MFFSLFGKKKKKEEATEELDSIENNGFPFNDTEDKKEEKRDFPFDSNSTRSNLSDLSSGTSSDDKGGILNRPLSSGTNTGSSILKNRNSTVKPQSAGTTPRPAFGQAAGANRPPLNTTAARPAATAAASSTAQTDAAKRLAEVRARLAAASKSTASATPRPDPKTSSRDPDKVPLKSRPVLGENKDVSDVQYRRFSSFIEEKCGIVLGNTKQYLVNSRLSTLLDKFHMATVDDIINAAMEEKPNNVIQDAVIDAMTTNETLWFRDTYPYLALQNIILPELAAKGKDYPVKIWSAACSSGQEPYSIAIVIQEQLTHMVHVDPNKAHIVGTDLSPEMLAHCKAGLYDAHALSRGLSPERKSKYFRRTRNPNMMQIDPKIKRMVEFRPLNLLGSFALMGKYDAIFCRNVLIYFSNDIKAQILKKLTMCLNPGGYLILGSTESLTGVAEKYEMMRCNPGIIYKLKPQKF